MKSTTLNLDRDLIKKLKHRAIDDDTTVSNIINKLIKDYLESSN